MRILELESVVHFNHASTLLCLPKIIERQEYKIGTIFLTPVTFDTILI